jgi:tetratricopeptide (TPR) repeat protein
MREKSISQLAYDLKQVKEQKSKAIFFLGAGASVTGSIPLAKDIAKEILEKYADNPSIGDMPENERSYSKLMDCLQVRQRQLLLKNYIDNAKINVTHIYLAHLMAEGFVDYVLTVNFDNLMLRALALYNIFPPTYDMAILKDLTTTSLKKNSVVYLHGQHHGLWLLNTQEEMKKVREVVPCIFHSIKNERPWVFLGYSGEDPVFEHIKKLGRFDDGCYWVAYNNNDPGTNVQEFLKEENRNASIIKGFDADAFMLKLNNALGLPHPAVLEKPFTMLKERILEIVDIDDKEQFKGVKERLEISKRWIDQSIDLFEENKIKEIEEVIEKQNIERLKKEIVAILSSEKFDEVSIAGVEDRALKYNNAELKQLIANIYFNWGFTLASIAEQKKGAEAEKLCLQAVQKCQKTIKINSDDYQAYYNWGVCLSYLAEQKEGAEAEIFYQQAFEKFQKAIEIKPDVHEAYYNWGIALGKLAEQKEDAEVEKIYQQVFEKYQKTIEIKPDHHEAYNNWGIYLSKLAKQKDGSEAEIFYQQAFEKFQKAIEIKPDHHEAYYNWGTCLGKLAKQKDGSEAEKLYQQVIEKCQKAYSLGGACYNLSCCHALLRNKQEALHYLDVSLSKNEISIEHICNDEDWKEFRDDDDFKVVIAKYSKQPELTGTPN